MQRYAAEADRDGRDDFEIGEIPKIDAHWHRYRCQVVGYHRAAHRCIRLNFFLPAPPGDGVPSDYWRKGYVLIADGGYGVWQVDYDVDQGRYLGFRSNGYG